METTRCSLGSCELGMKESESERAGAVLALSIFHEVKTEVISERVWVHGCVDNGAKRRRPIGVSVDNAYTQEIAERDGIHNE